MKYLKGQLVKALVDFFEEDARRIQHALDVLKHAEIIMGDYPQADPEVLISAALLHDVGIKHSEEELGYNNGATQETYGPPVVRAMLKSLDFPPEKVEKVAEIVGNHHSPSRFDYVELEILKQADIIVNQQEARALKS